MPNKKTLCDQCKYNSMKKLEELIQKMQIELSDMEERYTEIDKKGERVEYYRGEPIDEKYYPHYM